MSEQTVGSTKVLVIEDEADLRGEIVDILELEGYQVLSASNGKEGVALTEAQVPHLILCDVMMPEMDGYGVISHLRQNPETATIPFIFLTAKSEKADLRQGMTLGADDYLTKPFSRSELLEAIATQFQKQAAVESKIQQKLESLRSNITLSLPHELHTPLAGIIGMAELMTEDFDVLEKDEAIEMLDAIHSSAQRLYRLTKNFLLYAELEVMAADPQRMATLRQSGQVSDVALMVSASALHVADPLERGADLKFDLAEGHVQISELKLKKIIEELIDNALKFSEHGTSVTLRGQVMGKNYVLQISDRGCGMTPDQIENIGAYMQFERRIHEQQGSGLGMTIARRLTELHGGKFHIESMPGTGTTVRITLPLAMVADEL
jgi:signal transduction histidine kinase